MDTFADLAALWMDDVRRRCRPKSVYHYGIALRNFYAAVPEARERFITRTDLMRFRTARGAEVVNVSVNREVRAIKACLNWLWTNELPHPVIPLRRLLLPVQAKRAKVLTPDEVARIFDAASVSPRVLVVLKIAHATGFRLGEILHLWWRDVDDREGTLSVTAKPGWEPKTEAALRTVFAPELVRWLAGWRETLRHRGHDDFVCQQHVRTGTPWRAESGRIHQCLATIYKRAGVEGRQPVHAFRHTMGTDMAEANVPVGVAQKALGHSSPIVTLAIYTHAQKRGLREAGEAVERFRKTS